MKSEAEIRSKITEINLEMTKMKEDIKTCHGLEYYLKSEIDALDGELVILKWVLGGEEI